MVESYSMIKNIRISVLIDFGAFENLISPSNLIRCGSVSHDQNDFSMVEIESCDK